MIKKHKIIIITSVIPVIFIFLLFSPNSAVIYENNTTDPDTMYYVQYYRLGLMLNYFNNLKNNNLWEENAIVHSDTLSGDKKLLIKRLILTGDIVYVSGYPDSVDPVASLKNFQWRHGLSMTGSPDIATLKELNLSLNERIKTIEVNIDRYKKSSYSSSAKYISVNIPDFKLQLVEKGNMIMVTDVIIGRTYRKTPQFSADLTHIVFNPDWTIPPTILREDVLPLVKKDPSYLLREGINIYKVNKDGTKSKIEAGEIDWKNVSAGNFDYQLVKRPGPDNPLGIVKFMFPNKYNVYMHDTPAKELFKRSDRTFSSGCIRLADAVALAETLLSAQDCTQEELNNIVKSGKTHVIYLSEPVKVYIDYYTCWVDDNGKIHFRKDIYGQDRVTFVTDGV